MGKGVAPESGYRLQGDAEDRRLLRTLKVDYHVVKKVVVTP